MAQPANFGTMHTPGVDPTVYYIASASVTPETPAPPFQLGDVQVANNGSEFVFVQASTSIALGDFVAITSGFQANSLTTSNILGTSTIGPSHIGMASATLKQSVTLIPAGAFFWACRRGTSCNGNANSVVAVPSQGNVQLYTSLNTPGVITSITTSASLQQAVMGIEVISSATPVFNLIWPRTVILVPTTANFAMWNAAAMQQGP